MKILFDRANAACCLGWLAWPLHDYVVVREGDQRRLGRRAVCGEVDGRQVTQQFVLQGRSLCNWRRGRHGCGGVAAALWPRDELHPSTWGCLQGKGKLLQLRSSLLLPQCPCLRGRQGPGSLLLPQCPCLRGREGSSGVSLCWHRRRVSDRTRRRT